MYTDELEEDLVPALAYFDIPSVGNAVQDVFTLHQILISTPDFVFDLFLEHSFHLYNKKGDGFLDWRGI